MVYGLIAFHRAERPYRNHENGAYQCACWPADWEKTQSPGYNKGVGQKKYSCNRSSHYRSSRFSPPGPSLGVAGRRFDTSKPNSLSDRNVKSKREMA